MGDRITSGQLRVKCRFIFMTIYHCKIHAEYGRHTCAKVVGTVKNHAAKAVLNDIADEKVEIFSTDGEGKEELLFVGVLNHVDYREEGQYATLCIKAVSYTWKMDIEKKSRSFQDLSRTYRDVAEHVIGGHDAVMVWNISDRPLEHPLIQYKETDYSFLRRILSHLERSIIPVDMQGKIRFKAGLDDRGDLGEIDIGSMKYSLLSFSEHMVTGGGTGGKQYGYEIHDMNYARVGDRLTIQGRIYYVMEMTAEIEKGVLNCTCRAFPKQCFVMERIPADTLKGAALTGKIIAAKQEMVKLHLDIDEEQPIETACDFPWKPITGNMLYCMPEKGTRAAAYIDKYQEDNIAVIYNIRENGETCAEVADYNERYFTTDNSKRMYLKPSEMGLHNMDGENAEIALKDSAVLHIKTNNQLSVLAEGQVELKGKSVTITTPKEATLVKKDIISPTVINMCNAFDAIGCTGNFTATPQEVKEKQRKAPPSTQKAEKYSLDGVIGHVLSSVPVNNFERPLMESVAGSMPVISRIGDGKRQTKNKTLKLQTTTYTLQPATNILQPARNAAFAKLGSTDLARNIRIQGGEMQAGKVKLQPVENMTFKKPDSADPIRNVGFQGGEIKEGKAKLQPITNATFAKLGATDLTRNAKLQVEGTKSMERKVFTGKIEAVSVADKKYGDKRS